jgi:drug/metabolite transporter (DMT)-like permease
MCLIWGIPYVMIRVAVRDLEPGTLVFCRTTIGALALLPLALRQGGFRAVARSWVFVVAFAVIEMAVPWAMLGQAETKLPSSITGLLICGVPFVVILLSRVRGVGDRLGVRAWGGLLLGLVGLVLLVGLDFSNLDGVSLLEVLVTVIGYAIGPMIMNEKLSDLPRFTVTWASLTVAAVIWAPYGLTHLPSHIDATPLASVIALGLVCTALAFVVFFALIEAIGPARSTIITYVNTAVAVLAGVVLLGEDFTVGIAVGFPLILVGSVLGARISQKKDARKPAAASGYSGSTDSPDAAAPDPASPDPASVDPHSTVRG